MGAWGKARVGGGDAIVTSRQEDGHGVLRL